MLLNDPALRARGFKIVDSAFYGARREAFGEALCRTWRFPIELQRVSGFHHRALDLEADVRGLTSIVYVAAVLAAQSQLGYVRTADAAAVNPDIASLPGLSRHDLEALLSTLPSVVAETAPLYSAQFHLTCRCCAHVCDGC